MDVPAELEQLVAELAGLGGAVAVVLGGSRATGEADEASDWDLGVYYRGALDLEPLRRRGEVHAPGSWGRIMNGGAWLTVGGRRVDVILRDADVVADWSARARAGDYEVDGLLGYLAGIPTYSLLAEVAVAVPLRGRAPAAEPFPPRLATTAPPRWRFHRDFSLAHARARARRGDAAGAVGQAARAALEEAHARLCARRAYALNEKRLLERAGLEGAQALFGEVPRAAAELPAWVERLAAALAA
jgi:hypothetical protein